MRYKYLNYLVILATLLIIIPSVNALSVAEVAQSFSFNWAALFLVIFLVCWMILQGIFKSTLGMAVIISLVLALGGSVTLLNQIGPIIPKLNIWVILLFAGLVIFILNGIFSVFNPDKSKHKEIMTNLMLFIFPLAWFFFAKARVLSMLTERTIYFIDMIAGVLILIAVAMLIVRITKPATKEQEALSLQGRVSRPTPAEIEYIKQKFKG